MILMKSATSLAIVLSLIIAYSSSPNVEAAKILAIIPFPGRSHYIFQQPLMEELAKRGHEVTVITSYEEKNPVNDNYKQIVVDKKSIWDSISPNIFKLMMNAGPIEMIWYVWKGGLYLTEVALNSTTTKIFMKHDHTKFDLVISELFYQEAMYAFAYKYNAPLVTICTFGNALHNHYTMGNPVSLAYIPSENLPVVGHLNLWQKFVNLMTYTFDVLGRKYYYIPRQEELIKKYFKDLPTPLPSIYEMERNVSLSLLNTHFSVDRIVPIIPSFIEIGGIHLKPATPLPPDLSEFIETAPKGIIYFSLGSNLQSKDMDQNKIDAFLRVFSRLEEKIIWKWEMDDLPNKTDNVLIRKWLPQTDILDHPKVKLFITHGGLLSTHEALYRGVPIVGIPVYGDQGFNIANAQHNGVGVLLPFKTISEETITIALTTILNDTSYNARAKELSLRFRDRPLTAMDNAIYWIEYIIRNKGAKYMRSPIGDIYWYEYYMIDVLSCIAVSLIVLMFVITTLVRAISKTKRRSNEMSQKKLS